MEDQIELNGEIVPIKKVKLNLPDVEGTRYLYLSVDSESDIGGFFLWEIQLPLLENINNLDGQRIHLYPDGEAYEDDTLGTDIIGAYHTNDLNYWHGEQEDYAYGEILIDFIRIEGHRYRVRIKMTMTNSEDDPANLPPESFQVICKAEFTVTVDQKDPYSESLKTS